MMKEREGRRGAGLRNAGLKPSPSHNLWKLVLQASSSSASSSSSFLLILSPLSSLLEPCELVLVVANGDQWPPKSPNSKSN